MTETLDETQARHLAAYRELAEMTMSLARKAHGRAAAQLDETEPPAPYAKDETLRFTRLANVAHQVMRGEAHAVAAFHRRAPAYRTPAAADPRHALIRRTLHRAVRDDPDAARLRRGIDHELEREIAADPARTVHPGDLLGLIANRIQIPIDPAHLPDELLPDDDEPDEEHDEEHDEEDDPERKPSPIPLSPGLTRGSLAQPADPPTAQAPPTQKNQTVVQNVSG